MTIAGIGTHAPVSAPTPGPTTGMIGLKGPLGGLSVGEAMEYLATYLSKSDSEIRTKMEDLQTKKEDSEKLGNLITQLQTIARHGDADGWVRDKEFVDQAHDLLKANPEMLSLLSPDTRKSLELLDSHYNDTTSVAAALKGPGDPAGWTPPMITVSDSKVSKDDVDAVVKALTNEASQLTSANELKMIQLQSAISARGNLLSMVSNMVKSFDDNAKSIVGNMR